MVNFISVLILAALSSQSTRLFILRKNFPPVRASSLTTIIFISIYMLSGLGDQKLMHAAILGGSFIGMTEVHRLKSAELFLAAVAFTTGFLYLLPLNPGFGGALGFLAFTSCILTWFLLKIFVRLKGKS